MGPGPRPVPGPVSGRAVGCGRHPPLEARPLGTWPRPAARPTAGYLALEGGGPPGAVVGAEARRPPRAPALARPTRGALTRGGRLPEASCRGEVSARGKGWAGATRRVGAHQAGGRRAQDGVGEECRGGLRGG